MKNNSKIFAILTAGFMFSLTSCIDETFPESSTATAEQVAASPAGLAGALGGMSTAMCQGYYVYGGQTHETDMAYPAYMIAQTEMLSDLYPLGTNSGYDWYRSYNVASQDTRAFGSDSYFAYLPWFTFYKLIKTCNDVIGPVDLETETNPNVLQYVGSAYASRAFQYYMLCVLYEPVKNQFTDCSAVLGSNPPSTALTVVKILPETTKEEAKNNTRMTHDEAVEFMLSDLAKAEKCLANNEFKDRTAPTLATVYGIMAKVYLWDEDYTNAAECARKAIDLAGNPMTKTDWLDKNSAFSKACDGWMWYLQYSAENMGNLCNFVGWISGEADWGYSSLTCPGINKILYDKMGENDFRRGAFLDPDRSVTLKYYDNNYSNMTSRDQAFIEDAPDYLALKFRCLDGNWEAYAIGGASQVPVMRVEEMYFIEALAEGEKSVEKGVSLLNTFMTNYRDGGYSFSTGDKSEFEQELLTQMRIEFWGEGNAFPIAKRIGMDVLNNYEGTNAPADLFKVNYQGFKPSWTLCIPDYETQSNQVLASQNNPNPTGVTTYPTPIGEWATKK